ncbi:MAG TPA: coproporphyrinogen III oxidase, partial [Erythrobacter sp.]|nr:coproporphyrinogen III oxidase [Erythrobacter sp.]
DLGMAWSDGPRIGVTPRGMPVLDALLGELVQADLVTS